MDNRQRQVVVFLGFTGMLIFVMVFLLAQGEISFSPSVDVNNSTAVQGTSNAVNDSVSGWKQAFRDIGSLAEFFSN